MKTYLSAGACSLILLAILIPLKSSAQPEKLYTKGMKAFYKEKFDEAIGYFEEIESSGRTFKDTKYRKEISYLVQKEHRERDLTTFLAFRQYKAKSDKFYHYWLGRIYANRYAFPEAVDSWKTFLSMKAYKSDEIIEETQDFLAHTEYMVKYFDNPDNYEVHQLGSPINSEYAELSPVFSKDNNRLIFTSNRNNSAGDVYEVFQASSTDSGWDIPKAITSIGQITREKANIEIVNEDGKLFIFREEKKNKGDLFYSELSNQSWSEPVEFDNKITSTHLKSHFYINEHEDRIIFSAPNKKLGLDLFESFKDAETGKWESPHPFAPTVNSGYDEDSPFLSADESKFYFSSDKPGGIGGFDIYVCTYDPTEKKWSEAENLGWPINSPDDEQFFKMNPDGTSGYFSSNRIHSLGDYDIFYFWEIQKTKVEGRVLYAHNEAPVLKGEVRFHPTQYLDEYFRSKIDEEGKYSTEVISNEVFRVEIMDGFDTLLTQPFAVVDVEGESVTHHKDFYVIAKDLGEEETTMLKNKYASEQIVPEIKEIVGPTSKALETPKNTEESENTTEDSTELTELQDTTTALIADAIEEQKDQPEEEKPIISEPIAEIKAPVETEKNTPQAFNTGETLTRIFFPYNGSQLIKQALPKLEELVTMMNANSEMKILIEGHTDNIGSKQTNQMVSEKRAQNAKNWVVKKGINKDRIIVVGYGESRPLASNDDEENGRELNRRIEVKTLKN
ncbi:MAG: OmpA family protein [Cyclobacteriaceae bacterium]